MRISRVCTVATALFTASCAEEDEGSMPFVPVADDSAGGDEDEDEGDDDGEEEGEGEGDGDGDGDGGDDDPDPQTTAPPEDDPPPDDEPPPCTEGEFSCVGDHIEACENGDWQEYGCAEICGSEGYTTSGCGTSDQCNCDGFADAQCVEGVTAFCVCAEYFTGTACTDEEFLSFYSDCFHGKDPIFACHADYVSGTQVDCYAAGDACF